MIVRMSKKVSSFFIDKKIISCEDREVYEYSFEILFSSFLSIAAVMIMALLSKTIIFTTLYMIGFIPLRLIAGGYHAKNHFRCFIILMCTYSAFLLLITFLPHDYLIFGIILTAATSVALTYLFAPSEDKNKPVSNNEKIGFKKKSRISITIYIALACLLAIIVSDMKFAFSLTLGNLTVAVSLLANYIKCKKIVNNAIAERG